MATGAHIQGVGRSLERGWTSSMAELAKKPHFLQIQLKLCNVYIVNVIETIFLV